YGSLTTIGTAVLLPEAPVRPIKPCIFTPGRTAEIPSANVVIHQTNGPDTQFKIEEDSLIPMANPLGQICTFMCAAMHEGHILAGPVEFKLLYVETVTLSIQPEKTEHHVLLGQHWSIFCLVSPVEVGFVLKDALQWNVSCSHMDHCATQIRSGSLAGVIPKDKLQVGVYSATCSLPDLPMVAERRINVHVHPSVELGLSNRRLLQMSSKFQPVVYRCEANTNYLYEHHGGVLRAMHLRGARNLRLQQEELKLSYLNTFSIGMYCCVLESRIARLRSCYVFASD
ncbi:unnamed protein product, partial [Dicrocoelium dendriticum]